MVHFGLGYVYREPTQDNSSNATGPKFETVRFRSKPESNVLQQRFVDTGELVNVAQYTIGGAEFAMQWDALTWQSEYQWTNVDRNNNDDLSFDGYYSQIAYTLTGEVRPYKTDRGIFDGIRPNRNFDKGGWGAFEIAYRLSGIDLNERKHQRRKGARCDVRAELVSEPVSAHQLQHRRRDRSRRRRVQRRGTDDLSDAIPAGDVTMNIRSVVAALVLGMRRPHSAADAPDCSTFTWDMTHELALFGGTATPLASGANVGERTASSKWTRSTKFDLHPLSDVAFAQPTGQDASRRKRARAA